MRKTLLALMGLLAAFPALADDDRVPPVADPLVRKECGSCHMAFQPALLPARSWERMMKELGNHFGEDATLSPAATEHIRAYLVAHAGRGKRIAADAAPQRITETPSFLHEHRFPERVWKDPKVVTRSNCPACHLGAEQGVYEDD